jgi:hypothetical protein
LIHQHPAANFAPQQQIDARQFGFEIEQIGRCLCTLHTLLLNPFQVADRRVRRKCGARHFNETDHPFPLPKEMLMAGGDLAHLAAPFMPPIAQVLEPEAHRK